MTSNDRSPQPGDTLRLTIVKDEPAFDSLLDDWNRLGDTAEPPNFFVTPNWVRNWWRHFHQGAVPRIFVYHDDLGPRALFPLMLRRQRIDALGANVLGFMVNEESTKPQWLIRGDPAPILRRWTADLAADQEWDVLEMADLPANTAGLDLLPGFLTAHGWRWIQRPGEGALVLGATGEFEDYWQGRGAKLRKGIRYRENRLRERGELKVEISRPGDDPQKWMDRILGVAAHTWKTARRTSLADGPRCQFFTDVVKEMLPTGQAQVFVASLAGKDIAYDLTFIHRGILYGLKTDYHQDYRDLAPGMLLIKRLIQYGYADPRVQSFDFITDTPWMRRWTETVTESVHLTVFNHTLTGRTLALLEKNLRPVGRVVKRLFRREKPG